MKNGESSVIETNKKEKKQSGETLKKKDEGRIKNK